MPPNRRSQHVTLQQGLDRTRRPHRQPAPRQPAVADTGADTGVDAGADESPSTALLRIAAAEMAGDEESDPTTPTPRVSQRQPQPQLPPYIRSLDFDEKLKYSYLRRIFRDLFMRERFDYDHMYDWTILEYLRRKELQEGGSEGSVLGLTKQ